MVLPIHIITLLLIEARTSPAIISQEPPSLLALTIDVSLCIFPRNLIQLGDFMFTNSIDLVLHVTGKTDA